MRKALRILAVMVVLTAAGIWAARGAHGGWTVNNIRKETPDPVTGLVGVSYEKGFLPGVDFLAGAGLAGGVLTGASFLFRKKNASLNVK